MSFEVVSFLIAQALLILFAILGTYSKMSDRLTRMETKVELLLSDNRGFKVKIDGIQTGLAHLEGHVNGLEHAGRGKRTPLAGQS